MATGLLIRPDSDHDQDQGTSAPDLQHIKQSEGVGNPLDQTSDGKQGVYDDKFNDILGKEFGNTASTSGKTDSPGALDDAENNAASTEPTLGPEPPKKRKFWTTNRARLAGGGAGAIVTLSIGGLSMFTGPLEFVHIANILHDAHFSSQENASDSRIGKAMRWLRGDKRPGKTRLTWLGAKYHDKILADLKKIGITPTYEGADFYNGFEIDPEKNPDYKGMTPEEAAAKLEADTGIKPTIKDGKLQIQSAKFFVQRKSLKWLAKSTGGNGLAAAARLRVLKKFGEVTFHPLKILDKKFHTKITVPLMEKFKEKWQSLLEKGKSSIGIDTSKAQDKETGTDSNGDPTTTTTDTPGDSVDTSDPGSVKEKLQKIKVGSSAGAVAAVTGIVCALKALNDSIALVRYANVILPMIRMGLNAITVGNQIMAGQDVDPAEIAYLAQSFVAVTATGATISTWNDAKSIRQWTGQNGGLNVMSDVDGMFQNGGGVSWLSWTRNGAIGTLCGQVAQTALQVFSFGLSIFSGGVISEVIGAVITPLVAGPLINKAADLLAGKTVNVLARGAQWGGYVDYGALLGANDAAVHLGGVKLSGREVAMENSEGQSDSRSQFDSENFIARIFDVYDYRSLTGRLADMVTPSFSANMYSTLGLVTAADSALLKMPMNILSSVVHADAPQYIYGNIPTFDIPPEQLNDSLVDNPYDNADKVGNFLDANCLNSDGTTNTDCSYIKAAKDCFGDDIVREAASPTDPTQVWDVQVDDQGNVDLYDEASYNADACRNGPDGINATEWEQERFFILDTGTMEGYTCAKYQDAGSCANNESTTGSSETTTSTASFGGDAKTLAKDVLNDPNVTLTCGDPSVQQDVEDAADGASGTANKQPTDARVFQLIEAIAKDHTVCISGIQLGGKSADDPSHYQGLAVDFKTLNGANLTGRDMASKQIISIAEQAIPGGGTFGQSQCGSATLTSGWSQKDTGSCNGLHVEFPAAAPSTGNGGG